MIKSSQGFSLLEVLVAFAILGVSLGVLLQIFSTGLQTTTLSEEYTYATSLAESKLATIGIATPYMEGVEEGKFNEKYAWRTIILPYEEAEEANLIPYERVEEEEDFEEQFAEDTVNMPVIPYRVKVEVFWGARGKERSIVLETLRLAPKQ